MNSESRKFAVDGHGVTEEIPKDIKTGQTTIDLSTQEVKVHLQDGTTKRFYADREGHRVLDIDNNEWFQLDPDASVDQFIHNRTSN